MKNLARLLKDESGVTAIEYGLIAAATGLALVAAMPPIKAGLTTIFGEVFKLAQREIDHICLLSALPRRGEGFPVSRPWT